MRKTFSARRPGNPKVQAYIKAARGQHVTPVGDKWQVKKSGADRATKKFSTQAEAISFAREIALRNQAELFVHGKNGQIRERNSYGRDPFPPKG